MTWTCWASFAQVRDRDRAVREHEVEVAVEVEVGPRVAPAGRVRADRGGELGARVGERRCLLAVLRLRYAACSWPREFVTKRSVLPSPVEVGGGDAHAGVRVGDVLALRDLLEAEAEVRSASAAFSATFS